MQTALGNRLVEQIAKCRPKGPRQHERDPKERRAGIKPGDIILMVNDAAVASPDQFRRKVESAGSSVALLVDRNRERMFVTIDTS